MNFEDFALKILNEDLGLEAEKIEEGTEETPDFIAIDEENIIYIELKEKDSSDQYIQEREAAFESGELYSSVITIESCSNTSRVIRKAKNQLKSEGSPGELRVIWLHAHGSQREALVGNFMCSLYGMAEIYDIGEGQRQRKDCYYFDHSDFFRYRDCIDAAIISVDGGMRLAVNNHSPSYDLLMSSSFVKGFQGLSLINPIELEAKQKIWIADCDLDRNNENAILDFLKDKYSLRMPRRIKMNQSMVEFSMPQKT